MKALENTAVMQRSTEEVPKLIGPVPTRPRDFRFTSLNPPQKICVCVKSWYQICPIHLYPTVTPHALPPDRRGHSPVLGVHGLHL